MSTEVSITGIHKVRAVAHVSPNGFSWITLELNEGWQGGRITLHCDQSMAWTLADAINDAMARVEEERADTRSYNNAPREVA